MFKLRTTVIVLMTAVVFIFFVNCKNSSFETAILNQDPGSDSSSPPVSTPPDSEGLPNPDEVLPVGIYMLADNTEAQYTTLAKPFVAGMTLRTGWKSLDTGVTGPAYDFSGLADPIARTQALGKKLTLAMYVIDVPQYVIASAAQTWTATLRVGKEFLAPIPWDASAIAHYKAFLTALGDYRVMDSSKGFKVPLREHPSLAQVDAGIVGLQTFRDVAGTLVKQPGYSRQTFLTAVTDTVRAVQEQFPASNVYLGYFDMADTVASPSLGDDMMTALISTFDGVKNPRISLFNEALKGDSPVPGKGVGKGYSTAVAGGLSMMFQACNSWTLRDLCNMSANDISPDGGMTLGYDGYGATYYEMYRADLDNTAFQAVFENWAAKLEAPK